MAWDLCRHVQIMWRASLRLLLSSPQTPEFASCLFFLFLFSLFGYTRARDLSLTVSSITSRLPGCHGCVQRRKPLDFRLEHRGSFSNPLSSFLTNTFLARFCLSASLWFFPSLAVPPPLLLADSLPSPREDGGWPRVPRLRNQCGGLFRQPGKFLLLHLSKSPLHLSNRVWDWRSWPDWAC